MTDTTIDAAVIHTLAELKKFESSLPPQTQLRFISGKSLDHSIGAIVIVYDHISNLVLLLPYYLNKSHQKVDKMDVDESPESLAMRLLLKEGKLKSEKITVMGSPILVEDNRPQIKAKFPKYIVLITSISPEDRIKIKSYSEKIGDPLWMNPLLLQYIFEEAPIINGIPRKHPHYEAYKRFVNDFRKFDELKLW